MKKARLLAETGLDDSSEYHCKVQNISRLRILPSRSTILPPGMAVIVIITRLASLLTILGVILSPSASSRQTFSFSFTLSSIPSESNLL